MQRLFSLHLSFDKTCFTKIWHVVSQGECLKLHAVTSEAKYLKIDEFEKTGV